MNLEEIFEGFEYQIHNFLYLIFSCFFQNIQVLQVVVLYARPPLQVDSFFSILREACKQPPNQSITVKWIDEDGKRFQIEDFRLFMNFEKQIGSDKGGKLHVFLYLKICVNFAFFISIVSFSELVKCSKIRFLGDPVSIDTQMELDEAFRCMVASGDSELNIHVFVGKPQLPGLPCQGEDSKFFLVIIRCYNTISE